MPIALVSRDANNAVAGSRARQVWNAIPRFIIYPIFQEFSEVLSKYYGKFILALACHFEAMHIIT